MGTLSKLAGKYRSFSLIETRRPVSRSLKYTEIVFCGYGESTYRLVEMEKIARTLKSAGAKKIRLNTIGLGNLINGRPIASELKYFIDEVSISLNTTDPVQWVQIHRPLPEFRDRGFESVLEFVRQCSKEMPQTYVSAVDSLGFDRDKFEQFIKGLGARVKFRPFLNEYESR